MELLTTIVCILVIWYRRRFPGRIINLDPLKQYLIKTLLMSGHNKHV